jgi:DNA-binding XRE family transcriptional regulator
MVIYGMQRTSTRQRPEGESPVVLHIASRDPVSLHRLAADLKQLCKQRGLSQSALAMKVGVSTSHLNQIINGRARPSAALLQRILEVLNAPRPSPKGTPPAPVGNAALKTSGRSRP